MGGTHRIRLNAKTVTILQKKEILFRLKLQHLLYSLGFGLQVYPDDLGLAKLYNHAKQLLKLILSLSLPISLSNSPHLY